MFNVLIISIPIQYKHQNMCLLFFSTEHMKLNMKARTYEIKYKYNETNLTSPINSNRCKNIKSKLTDHTSIPDTNYDSSQEIEMMNMMILNLIIILVKWMNLRRIIWNNYN